MSGRGARLAVGVTALLTAGVAASALTTSSYVPTDPDPGPPKVQPARARLVAAAEASASTSYRFTIMVLGPADPPTVTGAYDAATATGLLHVDGALDEQRLVAGERFAGHEGSWRLVTGQAALDFTALPADPARMLADLPGAGAVEQLDGDRYRCGPARVTVQSGRVTRIVSDPVTVDFTGFGEPVSVPRPAGFPR